MIFQIYILIYHIQAIGLFCGFSTDELGIDIERIRNIDFKLAKLKFTKNECEYIVSADNIEWNSRFIQLWTLKESYIKNIGKGLNIPLNSFPIDISNNTNNKNFQYSYKNLFFKQIEYSNHYYLAECSGNNSIMEIKELNLNELLSAFI